VNGVTVIVPAYNEGPSLADALSAIAGAFAAHGAAYEVSYLIVDDGSADHTLAVAEAFARRQRRARVLRHERNRGLGAALRTAFAHVATDYAVVLDADLSYSPATALQLLEALQTECADVALASPYACGGSVRNVPLLRRILSREANRLLSLATNGRYATLTCMVRAYRVCALRRLQFRADGMPAIAEMLLSALRQNLRVVEVPAALHWSQARRSGGRRPNLSRLGVQIVATVLLACRYRPALWLALPGLFPGLLPLVVAVLLAFRVSTSTLAVGTTVTIVIQYTSLALFTGQITAFIRQRFNQRRRYRSNGVSNRGLNVPTRTA
jgi:dolichol-phosphate mannosyltransferase